MRRVSLVIAAGALVFSLLSFVFSLVAITSKDWAVQQTFNSTITSPKNWTKPIFTLYRSPFQICSAKANKTIISTNTTISNNATDDDGSSSENQGDDTGNATFIVVNQTIYHWNVSCHHYRPFGFDRTSCELEVATQDDQADNVGDSRLCQQIHLAGNFSIASTVFMSLGFLLIAALAIATVIAGGSSAPEASVTGTHERRGHEKTGAPTGIGSMSRVQEQRSFRRSQVFQFVNLAVAVFLVIGVVTAVIAQFYAIEGLVQSLPNNSDFASSSATSEGDVNTHGLHGPWYQGKALSTYWTCAWGFAMAAAFAASMAWRYPRWHFLI
jgi:hypothetical protein